MNAATPADVTEAARLINGILAPSLMISACGLLVLALQGRYSHLMDRIRILNQERRRYPRGISSEELTARLESVRGQIRLLLVRARLVRNSVFCFYIAIASFVASSIALGTLLVFGLGPNPTVWLGLFMAGMAAVLLGAVFALKDVAIAFEVAELEVRDLD